MDRLVICITPQLKEKVKELADARGQTLTMVLHRLVKSLPDVGKPYAAKIVQDRRKKSKQLYVKMKPAMKRRVCAIAHSRGQTITAVVTPLLEEMVAARERRMKEYGAEGVLRKEEE